MELVEHAENGLHSLAYHLSASYIDTCVKLCSQMYVQDCVNLLCVLRTKNV